MGSCWSQSDDISLVGHARRYLEGSPSSRDYKAVLRSCANEAERGDIARDKLAHALLRSLTDLSPSFMRRLQAYAGDLPGLVDIEALGANNVLEGLVAKRFCQLEATGRGGADLVQRAVTEGFQQLREAMSRHVRQHCHEFGGEEAAETIAAYAAAESTIDLPALAAKRIAGEKPARAVPRAPVSLEEDLTREA